MVKNIVTKKSIKVIYLILATLSFLSIAYGENTQGTEYQFQFLTRRAGMDVSRFQAIGEALNFKQWTQTEEARVAPFIDKSLLSQPELVSRESKSYDVVQFGRDSWGCCRWSADYLVENVQSLPTELPPDREKTPLQKLKPKLRNDPNFVKDYLQKKLKRYKEPLRYSVKGGLDVKICLAPNSKAAHEYLLSRIAANTMPTDLIVKIYSSANRLPELGTISYITRAGHIKFIRNNVVVIINARGRFSNEALGLAKKIDSMIKQQPPLTYQQLVSRRPAIELAANIDKERTNGRRTISYNIATSNKEDIVCLRASTTKGQYEEIKGGKIFLPNTDELKTIEVIAITKGLLANTIEKEIDLRN